MLSKFPAIDWILGNTTPGLGTEASASTNGATPVPKLRKNANTKTIIPIPPIQLVSPLHKIKALGKALTSSIILAPVVVIPDTDSNKASTNCSSTPLK